MWESWLAPSVGIKGRCAVNPLTPTKAFAGRLPRRSGAVPLNQWSLFGTQPRCESAALVLMREPRFGSRALHDDNQEHLAGKTRLWFGCFIFTLSPLKG